MADTVVATYGGPGYNTPGFTYCGFRAASGSGTDPPPDGDLIRVWLNQCSSFDVDVAHVTVEGSSDDGDPSDQFVWVAEPGGTHITHYGDTDGGSGDLSIPVPFGFPGYYNIRVASRADLDYCVTVTFTYCDPDRPEPADHLVVEAPPTAYIGEPFDFTVTALDGADVTDTAYAGTDTFTSDEGGAELPADSPLTSGVGTFSATLNAAGTWTITATDTADGSITGTSGPIVVTARPPVPDCKVWGDWAGDGEEWWDKDGTSTSGVIIDPPDGASFRYSGGSDGRFHYLLSLDDTYPNQFWVSKFTGMFTARVDRWEVTGWTGSPVGVSDKFWDAFSDNQPVCADATRIVVIVYAEDRPGAFYEEVAFEVTIFDTTGTIVDQWSTADPRRISGYSGSCLDADSVFFGIYDDDTSDELVGKINLSTGVLTDLFLIADVDAAITALDGSWGGLSYTAGIVEVDGDLIINGYAGVARVQQDGTPVWWQAIQDSGAEYRGLAHSGRGSVWACDYNAHADEYLYDGTFVQTITLPEYAAQAWLGPCVAASDWHVGGAFW